MVHIIAFIFYHNLIDFTGTHLTNSALYVFIWFFTVLRFGSKYLKTFENNYLFYFILNNFLSLTLCYMYIRNKNKISWAIWAPHSRQIIRKFGDITFRLQNLKLIAVKQQQHSNLFPFIFKLKIFYFIFITITSYLLLLVIIICIKILKVPI